MAVGTNGAVNMNKMCAVWALEDADEAIAETYTQIQNCADRAFDIDNSIELNTIASRIHALRTEMQELGARIRTEAGK